jgi:threonine/homoserine/homoserine lactone efflux protein
MEFLIMGVALGLYAGLSPGPLLVLTISETLRHDAAAGMRVALAPVLTDLPIILLAVFLLSRFSGLHDVLGGVSLAGGCFLLYLAVGSLRTRGLEVGVHDGRTGSLTRGILVNLMSPHPYLFWLTVGAPLIVRAGQQGPAPPLAFLGGFYVLLVGSKMALAVLTGRFKAFLSGPAYRLVMRLLGLMLLVLAVVLFHEGLRLLELL